MVEQCKEEMMRKIPDKIERRAAFEKIKKSIESCKTNQQLHSADNMIDIFKAKYDDACSFDKEYLYELHVLWHTCANKQKHLNT